MSNYVSVKKQRRTVKEKLFAAFSGRCGICNIVDDPVIYDFHHLDSQSKEFQLSQQCRSWEKVKIEALKCVMLCAPCHRKHHAGLIDIPSSIPRFDETLVPSTVYPKRGGRKLRHTHLLSQCEICNGVKQTQHRFCSHACANKASEKIDWDNLNEWLIAYKNPYRLSKHIGVSDVAIRKQMKKRGLTNK